MGRAAGLFRTAFYLPNVTPAVAVGTLFLLLLAGDGLLNRLLGAIGLDGPNWLTDPTWVKPGIVIMSLWSLGSTVIIYFAAMRNVPDRAVRGGHDRRRRHVERSSATSPCRSSAAPSSSRSS